MAEARAAGESAALQAATLSGMQLLRAYQRAKRKNNEGPPRS